ncbi:hypothetical protein M408DRAFT_330808 [Serendipita vermifera MAFF 305830]|uniref:Major facilitator superfamily (MFS) profile domain-containing protein n=1 Tax=Serendipita vermifera MAFF 305830 TaxID=933852 RepID=A0A0C2WI28_SERVB|nr:hypothetical protein M408DRAFT_330808 [Serendipita vermifera MAFF 305830]
MESDLEKHPRPLSESTKTEHNATAAANELESQAPTLISHTPDPQLVTNHQAVASRDSLPAALQEAAARTEVTKTEKIVFDDGPIPDGGFGWVIVICQFFSQMATWGMLTTYGVYTSWFIQERTFEGPNIQYAWIAGLGVSIAFFISPLTSYLCKLLPLRINLLLAQIMMSLGYILAGFSTQIWALALTQGLMAGIGVGWNFMATQPLISQWFQKRRGVAMGLSSAGVGAGGLVFSFTTRAALAEHGVRWSYIIHGLVIFVMLTPTTILFRPRMRIMNPKFKLVRIGMLRNLGLVFICLWSFFVMLGYMIPLLSIATYSTLGVGLTQAQGASIQAVLAAGQLVGRPGLGLFLDAWGRINMASIFTFLAGVTCLCIWMFAKNYGLLIFFALVNGVLSGIFFSALGPLLSEVVGLKDFSDSLAIIWIVTAPITLVAVPMAFALNTYSTEVLGRTGADIFQISIALAGGANVVAAICLFMVKRFQRKDKD